MAVSLAVSVPSLVGLSACKGVCLVITDGDLQECAHLDATIDLVFTATKHHHCGAGFPGRISKAVQSQSLNGFKK